MPTTRSIHAYKDVKDVLDTALAHGGGVYTLPTAGKAIHWRQRAYAFRLLAIEEATSRSKELGYVPTTPYDTLLLELDENKVRIGRKTIEGVLEVNEPGPGRLTPPSIEPLTNLDDDFLDAAILVVKDAEKQSDKK